MKDSIFLWAKIIIAFVILGAILYIFFGIFGIIFLGLCFLWAFVKENNNHKTKHTAKGDWTHISNIKMASSAAQQVFDYYKKALLEDKIRLSDALKDVDLRREYHKIKNIKDSLQDDKDMVYIEALDLSFSTNSDVVPDGYILNPQEKCFFSTKSAEIKTIQKLCTNYSYSGFRYSDKGFRYGNITMYPEQVEGLKHFDDGELVLTNQRILFRGSDMKTKTIPIGTIVGIENFDENGVIIFLSNRDKPIVIKFTADKYFFYNKFHDIAFFYNDLNDFYYNLDKVLYERLIPKDIQENRKLLDEVNFQIARKTMIAEGFEKEK